jgi:hypothetical protein
MHFNNSKEDNRNIEVTKRLEKWSLQYYLHFSTIPQKELSIPKLNERADGMT